MKASKIEWTHHTFNPWRGCEKVSPGCRFCYAETLSKRNPSVLGTWGKDGTRPIGSAAYWRQPLAWDRAARNMGERHRVFCASLADVFEDRPDLLAPRFRLMELIWRTQGLDWLLLTKRPENIAALLTETADWGRANTSLDHIALREWGRGKGRPFPNVWLGTTVEDQQRADERIPHLLRAPAALRFLSVEPLLGRVVLRPHFSQPHFDGRVDSIGWVIVGCESGPQRRAHDTYADNARDVIEQCGDEGVPVFHKQSSVSGNVSHDPAEWPEDLRVREYPGGGR